MSQQLERRFIRGGQLRAKKDGDPGITGVGAVYNQQYDSGWMIEIMKPGAFSRAISESQDVRCLFNHDPNNLLGRTKSGTLRISDASDGLHFDCDTDSLTRIGADVRAMIDRGDLDGCSISFIVRSQTWRDETDDKGNTTYYREIEDVDLFDVGPVTFPAYEQTSVTARSLWPNGVPAEVRSHVPSLNADAVPAPAVVLPAPVQRSADACTCSCDSSQADNCANCDCDGTDCDSDNCGGDECSCAGVRSRRMKLRMRMTEATL
jgi:HK97 family phage prohead protease